MKVTILCLILLLAGCGTTNSIPTIYDDEESELPSKHWDNERIKGNDPNNDERSSRDYRAQNAIRYVDDVFYAHYEKLANQPKIVGGREKLFQLMQWGGTVLTAYFSWKAGQSSNDSRPGDTNESDKNYNDYLSKIGIATVGIAGLDAVLDQWHDKKKEQPVDTLLLEKNRRVILDCINRALLVKPIADYSVSQVKDDLDNYYRASGLSTRDTIHIWKLNCS